MNILITGANGFLGYFLCEYFAEKGDLVYAQTRKSTRFNYSNIKNICFDVNDDLQQIDMSNVDTIIHCAGRAHVMNETAIDPLVEYRKINVEGTINLAKKAIEIGVKRFIFISSIKVNGEETSTGAFTANDNFIPSDPYGLSKYEAEQALLRLAEETSLEVVILRPVLIYGKGVKANFKSMINLAQKKLPLPIGCLNNKRSMVSVYNLASLIDICLTHPKAKNQVFLASDQDDISVKELFKKLAKAQNNSLVTIPVPKMLIYFLASIVGKKSVAQRLCSSLVVDTTKNTELLNWKAPYSVEQSLQKMFNEESEI